MTTAITPSGENATLQFSDGSLCVDRAYLARSPVLAAKYVEARRRVSTDVVIDMSMLTTKAGDYILDDLEGLSIRAIDAAMLGQISQAAHVYKLSRLELVVREFVCSDPKPCYYSSVSMCDSCSERYAVSAARNGYRAYPHAMYADVFLHCEMPDNETGLIPFIPTVPASDIMRYISKARDDGADFDSGGLRSSVMSAMDSVKTRIGFIALLNIVGEKHPRVATELAIAASLNEWKTSPEISEVENAVQHLVRCIKDNSYKYFGDAGWRSGLSKYDIEVRLRIELMSEFIETPAFDFDPSPKQYQRIKPKVDAVMTTDNADRVMTLVKKFVARVATRSLPTVKCSQLATPCDPITA